MTDFLITALGTVAFVGDVLLVALYPFRRLQYGLLALGNKLFLRGHE